MSLMINPSKTALLAMHMQNDVVLKEGKLGGLFGEQAEAREVISKGKQLVELTRTAKIPVIHARISYKPGYTNVKVNCPLLIGANELNANLQGTWGTESLLDPAPDELTVWQQRVSPFTKPELEKYLQDKGIETLIIFGVATNVSVESAARAACDMGYNIIIVEDCCSASTLQAHEASIGTLGFFAAIENLDSISEKLN